MIIYDVIILCPHNPRVTIIITVVINVIITLFNTDLWNFHLDYYYSLSKRKMTRALRVITSDAYYWYELISVDDKLQILIDATDNIDTAHLVWRIGNVNW